MPSNESTPREWQKAEIARLKQAVAEMRRELQEIRKALQQERQTLPVREAEAARGV